MEIKIIEGRRIIEASRLSMEVRGKNVIGIEEGGRIVNIKGCEREEEAEELMEEIKEAIKRGYKRGRGAMIMEIK